MLANLRRTEAIVLILLAVSTSLFALQSQSWLASGASIVQWQSWATTAWQYFQPSSQDTWNQFTGLTSDTYNWHYFTLWGLASNIFSIVAADRLSLNMGNCGNCPFANRVDRILAFLESSTLKNPSTGIPYLVFSADTGLPITANGATNAADYGRMLISLFVLNRYLIQKGLSSLSTRLLNDVNSLNSALGVQTMSTQTGSDLYGYYVAEGFKLWGFNEASAENAFYNSVKNGPFVDSSLMYGVSGIPYGMRITTELQINAILEMNGIPTVTGTQAWTAFYGLASRIYLAQQNRWAQTGILTAWSEGALGLPNNGLWAPGFVYESISDRDGQVWVVKDSSSYVGATLWSQANGPSPNNQPSCYVNGINYCQNQNLPVTFSKIGFGFLSLYGDTTYTTALMNAITTKLSSYNTYGYAEGFSEVSNGPIDATWNVQTQDTILKAAAYQTLPLFQLTVTPAGAQIPAGGSTTFSISITFAPDYLYTTSLSLIGLPSDATGIFNPQQITPSGGGTGSSTLSITAGSTTGTFFLVIQLSDSFGLTNVATATLGIMGPDFSISANPAIQKILPGGSTAYNVVVQFLWGFSSPVTLGVTPSITGATETFNPSSLSGNGTSTLTINTLQSVAPGTYTLNITGSGGGKVHWATVTLKIVLSLSMLDNLLLNAPANTVYFIFPDSNSAHKKPPTVGYAQVTDWTALGYVYGAMSNMPQITALDTNTTYVDPNTGAPKIRNSVIVLFASRLVNSLVYYYEVNGISPLYWGFSGSWTGTEYYFDRSGSVVAQMSIPVVGGGTADMPLIEVFKDQFNNTVVIFSGFGWKGTFESGLYFKTVLQGSLSGFTDSWYIWSWQDLNGNSFPDWYEVNPTPVSHGS